MDGDEARRVAGGLPALPARKDVARLLGCSVRTVIRLEERGLLEPVRLGGGDAGRVHYSRSAVETLLVRVTGEPG